jgi:hypothetical protein
MIFAVCAALLAATGSAPAVERKVVEFVGFSRDESIVVWRLRLERPTAEGGVDELTVLRVVRTRDNEVLGSIRQGACVRRDRRGRRRGCDNQSFLAANPEWATAQPAAAWQRLRQSTAMVGKALNLQDSTVRLQGDADLALEMSRESDHIAVRGAPGQAIGFEPVARLLDGRMINLGHFREPAAAEVTLSAQVRVYFSPSGMTVAVLNRFAPVEGGGGIVYITRAVVLPEAIGTTQIGALRLAASAMRVAEGIYKDTHPSTADLWDQLVGKSPDSAPPGRAP